MSDTFNLFTLCWAFPPISYQMHLPFHFDIHPQPLSSRSLKLLYTGLKFQVSFQTGKCPPRQIQTPASSVQLWLSRWWPRQIVHSGWVTCSVSSNDCSSYWWVAAHPESGPFSAPLSLVSQTLSRFTDLGLFLSFLLPPIKLRYDLGEPLDHSWIVFTPSCSVLSSEQCGKLGDFMRVRRSDVNINNLWKFLQLKQKMCISVLILLLTYPYDGTLLAVHWVDSGGSHLKKHTFCLHTCWQG